MATYIFLKLLLFFFLILRRFIYYIAVFYFLFFVDFLLWFTEADFCHPVHTRIRHVFLPLMTSARLISSSQHGCRFISCIVACVSVFFLVRITWISVMVQKLYWFHYHISLIFLFFERYFICLHCGTFHHLFSAVLVKWESAASISGTQCPRFSLIIQNRQMTVCVCVCASGRRFTSSILGMNARIHYPDFHHLFKIGKKSGWFRDFFPQKLLTLAPSQAMWIAGRQELRGPSVPPLPRGHYSK